MGIWIALCEPTGEAPPLASPEFVGIAGANEFDLVAEFLQHAAPLSARAGGGTDV